MRWFIVGLLALLSACTDPSNPNASPEQIQRVAYHHDGPPVIALYTMINNKTGAGAHSALLINGSQRVVFDPAGTLRHEILVENDDVLYGMTPRILDFYTRAHARKTHHVLIQEIQVSPQVAERALDLAINHGSVMSAFCANSVSNLLPKLPGFESIHSTMFPNNLAEQFDKLPGVTRRELFEYDDEDKSIALREYVAELAAPQE